MNSNNGGRRESEEEEAREKERERERERERETIKRAKIRPPLFKWSHELLSQLMFDRVESVNSQKKKKKKKNFQIYFQK